MPAAKLLFTTAELRDAMTVAGVAAAEGATCSQFPPELVAPVAVKLIDWPVTLTLCALGTLPPI